MKNRRQQTTRENHGTFPRGCLVLLCLLVTLFPVQETHAVSCHCFRDRTFEPSKPASADPYILATARNSLVAAASGVDKGSVVRQRMSGATETDLWLSQYLSTQVERSADQLLSARDRSPSWSAALETLKLDTGKLGSAFEAARKRGDADRMARTLADQVLGRSFNAGEPTMARLGEGGTDIAESALSLYLAGGMNRTPESVWSEVKSGKRTWGELFNALGIRIDTVGDLIGEAVRKSNN